MSGGYSINDKRDEEILKYFKLEFPGMKFQIKKFNRYEIQDDLNPEKD